MKKGVHVSFPPLPIDSLPNFSGVRPSTVVITVCKVFSVCNCPHIGILAAAQEKADAKGAKLYGLSVSRFAPKRKSSNRTSIKLHSHRHQSPRLVLQ
jgi:hypothetical protein